MIADLSEIERHRLSLFKWFYVAHHSLGFDTATARRLAFARWLYRTGKIGG